MAFEEKLPDWNAVGIEPPQSLKNSGYKYNDEPAPDHFNYMFNRAYKVMQELQVEAASSADVASVSTTVTSITDRLDKASTADLTLARGTQTITSTRDKPFNLTSIKGRMLFNLLGRIGNFETTTGLTVAGVTLALNSTNVLYGNTSLQITLSSTSGRVSRSFATISGRTYVVAVDLRMGTATNARVDVTGQGNGNTVSGTTYGVSYMRFTANSTSHNVGITVTGANGQTAFADGLRVYEVTSTEYSAFTSLTASDVSAIYPYTDGLAGVRNPYAIKWADANKNQVLSLLAFDTELLANPTAASDADIENLYVGADGQYYKNSMWRKLQITGFEPWTLSNVSFSGSKRVELITTITPASTTGFGVKYEGTLLNYSASVNAPDQFYIGNSLTSVVISQSDSGWGDNYSPSPDEIKAYFRGYKMYDSGTLTAAQAQASTSATYNGTGTKQWVNLVGTPVGTSLPTTTAVGYTPYELMYKRSSSVIIPVPSEGSLSLNQGDNVIEVGSGIVLRETARPQIQGVFYLINSATPIASSTSNRVRSFLQVYRNGRVDQWTYTTPATDADKVQYGLQQAQIPVERFEINDTYSVTYFPLNYYTVAEFKGSYLNSEKSIISDLVRDYEQLARRVSVNELRKLEKESATPWITPTFLNLWSSDAGNPAAYRKKDNTVSMTGVVINGTTGNGTVIYRLPEGFKPKQEHHFACYAYQISDGSFGLVEIIIRVNGDVVVGLGGRSYLSFAGINFSVI